MRTASVRQCLATTLSLLLACLAACSPEDPLQQGEAPASLPHLAPTQTEIDPPAAYDHIVSWTGDLDGMRERRVLRVLTVYSVGRYYMDGAQEKGLVRESTRLFEDFINKRYDRKHARIHVVVIPVARNQLIRSLLEGRGDIIAASLSITPERLRQVDFSEPASKAVTEILVTGPAAPPLGSLEDLSGKTVYVRQSSSYRESVDTLNESLIGQGLEPIRVEAVSELLEDDDLVEMVNAGLLPWAIIDDYKQFWWEDVFEQLVWRQDLVFRRGGQLAWAFRKDSPRLAAAVNEFLQGHREGTLIGNVLRNRYVRDFDWAANALAARDYNRFEELEPIFRKYGERYGFEHYLIAAQGYQESRLNQSARSRSGAVGIMQVKPATARDKNVAIRDINTVDGNIHAGVKYLSFIRERYFSDADIDEVNRNLLALAAYNMGPARMLKVRDQAAAAGYDPNIWFDNVELAAARNVGGEPVRYVANIYKYYLAYTLSSEQLSKRRDVRQRAGIEETGITR
jgi:membrane-bound lytic murein transglycosylase MltF